MSVFVILGMLVVIGLAVTAVVLWRKVWRLEAQQAEQQARDHQQRQRAAQEHTDYIHESLNVIAKALLDDQVRIAEAAIRISGLVSNLPLTCDSKHRFNPIVELANHIHHIPTHDAWKALDKKERRRYEQELLSLEKRYASDIQAAAQFIVENPFGEYPYAQVH